MKEYYVNGSEYDKELFYEAMEEEEREDIENNIDEILKANFGDKVLTEGEKKEFIEELLEDQMKDHKDDIKLGFDVVIGDKTFRCYNVEEEEDDYYYDPYKDDEFWIDVKLGLQSW